MKKVQQDFLPGLFEDLLYCRSMCSLGEEGTGNTSNGSERPSRTVEIGTCPTAAHGDCLNGEVDPDDIDLRPLSMLSKLTSLLAAGECITSAAAVSIILFFLGGKVLSPVISLESLALWSFILGVETPILGTFGAFFRYRRMT